MNRVVLPFLLSFLLAPSLCLAMGSDHKSGNLPPHDGWPTGVYDAVNKPNRVHGYWINSSDTFFYKGSNAELQEMTQKLAQAKGAKAEVILHAGNGVARSPWSQEHIDAADWSVTISGDGAITRTQDKIRVDVWIGGSVTLDDLRFPPEVTVSSGGEIESFIKRHRESP